MKEKDVAIIVDLQSIRLIVPESVANGAANYLIEELAQQEIRRRLKERASLVHYGTIVESYFEDECQEDITENTGE